MVKVADEKTIWNQTTGINCKDEEALTYFKHLKLDNILEIGCGSGSWTNDLAVFANLVIGIDFSKSLLKTAHNRIAKNFTLVLADATNLPFGEGAVDGVIFTASLHHMPMKPCLQEAARTIRFGGVLAMIEPNGSNFFRYFGSKMGVILNLLGFGVSTKDERPININKVKSLLEKKGFTCWVGYLDSTLKLYRKDKNTSIVYTFDKILLQLSKKFFGELYGSSEFVLIAYKHNQPSC